MAPRFAATLAISDCGERQSTRKVAVSASRTWISAIRGCMWQHSNATKHMVSMKKFTFLRKWDEPAVDINENIRLHVA